jgi:uncharacterized membrane protein
MALNLVCAVLDRGPANLADMAVLLAIADSADKDSGEAWPSQSTIAARSRQTARSVRNVLERLRADGWLTWEARRRANGSQASNVYTVNLAKLGEDRGLRAERGSASGRNVVPPPPERGSTHAPERGSALEPSHHKEPCATYSQKGLAVPSRPAMRGAGVAPLALSPFQRSRVRSGQSILLDGLTLLPVSPVFGALRQAVRAQDALELGGVV